MSSEESVVSNGEATAVAEPEEQPRPLSPLDYQQLLVPFDPKGPKNQPEADYWRKTDKTGRFVTMPIIRHQGVQKIARLFGVRVAGVNWVHRDIDKLHVTCEVTVEGYAPLPVGPATRIVAREISLEGGKVTLREIQLVQEYWVPEQAVGIGEVNAANTGPVGKQFPQCFAFKRGYDRGVLDHLGLQCYGDSEAPSFAQGADYKDPQEEHPPSDSKETSNLVELSKHWKTWPQDIQDRAKALGQSGVFDKPRLAQVCVDCDWELDQIRAALDGWGEK